MAIVRFTGLKAWLFFAVVLIGAMAILLLFLGLIMLLLPFIALVTIFLVFYYLFYGKKKKVKKADYVDVKFKVKKGK